MTRDATSGRAEGKSPSPLAGEGRGEGARKNGKVYLVGAGPGAPDLLTLRAAQLLARAQVVLHDALVHPGVLALAPQARKIAVGKRCGGAATEQRFINRLLVAAAHRHELVVRLKGGDPMLFGRAQEEIDALERAGIEYEVVPGVSAAFAASAELGVSLTRRGVSRTVVFATPRVGHGEHDSDWAASVAAADTAALYMGAAQAEQVTAALLAQGLAPTHPVALVESASLTGMRQVTTLEHLPRAAREAGDGPVMILLGEVLRGTLDASAEASVPPQLRRLAR